MPNDRRRRRTSERLTEVFEAARTPQKAIAFDDASKIILFSDSHRGNNSWTDEFAHNSVLFFHALDQYEKEGFTYIEVGDGDELWENDDFAEIRREHDHVFWLLTKFHKTGRLHLLWGNHDIERQDPEVVRKHLHSYEDTRDRKTKELFGEIEMREGLVLRHAVSGQELFVVHGHQGSGVNDEYWRIGRLGVRLVWRRLQFFGFHDPTRPSANVRQQYEVEDNITAWICANHQLVICGHTHRPAFPRIGEAPYFNTGSCVHPRSITGIEIVASQIALVKWWLNPGENGVMTVTRQILVPPRPIADFMGGPWPDCPGPVV